MGNLHLLSTVHTDKSKVEILQNLVAFSEYMNFTKSMHYAIASADRGLGIIKMKAKVLFSTQLPWATGP